MKMMRWLGSTIAAAALVVAPIAATSTAQAIPEPYTNPGIAGTWVGGSAPAACGTGYLCAYVSGNADHGGWWRFKFSRCAVYNLAYWHDYSILGSSFVVNDQTGNVTTTYYSGPNGTGRVLQTMKPAPGQFQYVQQQGSGSTLGWNPVASIRIC